MEVEKLPVRINGEDRGELTVRRDGLMTFFEAKCPDPGRLVRLSVYGSGREGYLGVMEPEGEGLVLRRRLSREAMAAFPQRIEYAAEAGKKMPPPEPRRPQPRPMGRVPARSRQEEKREADTLWQQVGDGSLYTPTPEGGLRAIPMSVRGMPTGSLVERRTIQGIEYGIYRLRDGKIMETKQETPAP